MNSNITEYRVIKEFMKHMHAWYLAEYMYKLYTITFNWLDFSVSVLWILVLLHTYKGEKAEDWCQLPKHTHNSRYCDVVPLHNPLTKVAI